jgi:hypothetical protein
MGGICLIAVSPDEELELEAEAKIQTDRRRERPDGVRLG